MHAYRPARPGLSIALILIGVLAGCVSRNVESISREEAASMAPPPEPVAAGSAAPSVATVPGIDGTVTIDPAAGPAPDGVLYVIVRVSGRATGAPLAVKQLPGTVPASFRVTAEDAMIPGTPLAGDLDLIVRLDQDADAFSRQEGDLEGRVGPIQVGAAVEVVLGVPPGASGG